MVIRKKELIFSIQCIVIGVVLFWATNSFSHSAFSSLLRGGMCGLFSMCIYLGNKENNILNPYWLFSITPLSLVMYTEQISTVYLNRLSTQTWGLAIINIATFMSVLAYCLGRAKRKYCDNYDNNLESFSASTLKRNSIILTSISFIPIIYQLIFDKVMYFTSVISLCVYAAIIMSLKIRDKKWIALIISISALRFLTAFNKTDLIFFLFVIIIGIEKYNVLSAKSKKKVLVILFISSLFVIFVAFPLKTYVKDNGGNIIDFFTKNVKVVYDYGTRINWTGPEALKMPYMYLVTAWNNVQYVIETQNTRTYGLWLLRPLLGYVQLTGPLEVLYELIPYSSFNTFTYISVLFKDFGYWGSAIGSGFLGWFVAKMYTWYISSTNAWKVTCYSLSAIAVFEMFFSNHFFGLSYPFTIVILYFIFEKCLKIKG